MIFDFAFFKLILGYRTPVGFVFVIFDTDMIDRSPSGTKIALPESKHKKDDP